MNSLFKKTGIAILLLLGVLLASSIAQVAQFATSTKDAREMTIARYIDNISPQEELLVSQAVATCFEGIQREHKQSKPISVYDCLRQENQALLAEQIQISDEGMQSVSWPLSLFL
ncbi:hypothetical protein [Vibrio sinaloensis]|uniref:hypothetical protein n=1 Tax=Photobacterium sp. (strain ATCC 43367) TaxID=379097 RepID=UPI0035E74EA4